MPVEDKIEISQESMNNNTRSVKWQTHNNKS